MAGVVGGPSAENSNGGAEGRSPMMELALEWPSGLAPIWQGSVARRLSVHVPPTGADLAGPFSGPTAVAAKPDLLESRFP